MTGDQGEVSRGAAQQGGVGRGTALVTGAARGIGRGLAVALAAEGFDVAVHYRSSEADAHETARQCEALGVRAVTLSADLGSPAGARALVRAAHAAFPESGLAVLVNNVGNYVNRPLLDVTDEQWADMLGSNLTATFATCQEAAPLLRARGWGRIVNLGFAGASADVARPGIVPYVIAKAGVAQLSRSLAVTLAGSGVSVNVVSPGVIETSVSQPVREIPAGRVGTVAELVGAALFFVRASDYVTGQDLEVAGGWHL
ncbi:bifunctional dihydropteridine reductase/dihydrofolate reductase TmpR [Deinococcus soli (ex Cha et al. 2016)]|uniref:NAD(P)-dependent dehydrogenase (Short-subunit alcohol dehydrogenase family) n=2 Tax=Deinococcus soli (ex Cha et al. 2016) TaxID=1309411 RepID=A0ACC6KL48_9DEIO|nr:bifunctional dihydropteridine reductase/dihydrofolate reductase TmpR [Deinococcus soli (ex Cha et al. 2016)]MDR6220582.1 NAD(P)-dependent dehydrogenase (short-subunit alcohol dehydrogenase family) [Deinococcus soli (ex Cha et al. 2016)]MDR6330332.1 NAD(P)-dependent dehydrogenase (short-subunit alcohol dehydrogenase family) [Deinococcus soli (ex Cha et al. 2016)]MDR6753174.1 NAD(P)-dependent dehydrogenase (short-subunit alcohol dehydrogenase family) [Deinococcus soli (ex Cha et al. 2016)]